jgi:MFS family permease
LQGIEQKGEYHFNFKTALGLFKKRSLIFLFLNCFTGVFPWQVLTFWFFRYLETERGYDPTAVLITMVVAVLFLAAGYPIAGILGDYFFKKNQRGRLIVSATGILVALVLLVVAINVPHDQVLLFGCLLAMTCIFMPFAAPNVITTIYDMTLPEVRSTANAMQNFFEQVGSSIAPLIAGLIAVASTLSNAILIISVSAWSLCFIFITIATYYAPKDLQTLRDQLKERAAFEKAKANG